MNSLQRIMRVRARSAPWALGASLVLFFSCLPAFSQGGLGTINGTVTSMAGGPVAGATVSIIDLGRGETRPLTTDPSGLYSAAGLTPGAYTVRVEAMGFKTVEHTGITLPTGATLVVDFILEPGAASEVVTITAVVLPANAAAVVENQGVTETPTNGRSFVALVENRNTGQSTLPGSGGSARTTNGMRTDQNNPLIDGIYDGDIDTGWQNVNGFGFQGGVDPDILLPLDAIGEINNTSYPRAEYGWHVGNTSNIGIKSGTNALHGTAYGFGRDADMNARNAFRPPPTGICGAVPCDTLVGAGKTPYAMEQWGASIGGKIKKDKLFYFANYERERYNVSATTQIISFTDADLALGNLMAAQNSTNSSNSVPDAIYTLLQRGVLGSEGGAGGGTIKQVMLNAAGCQGLTASGLSASTSLAAITAGCNQNQFLPGGTGGLSVFYAAANDAPNTNPTAAYAYGVPSTGGPDAGIAKIDYHLNNQNAINGEFYSGVANALSERTPISTQPWWFIDSAIKMEIARAVWVFTPNTSMVNEARFGMDWVKELASASDCGGVNGAPYYPTQWGFYTGGQGGNGGGAGCEFPYTTVTGYANLSFSPGAGPYTSEPRNYIGIDSFSWTRGKHVIKFGVEIRRGLFTGDGGGGTGPPIRGTLAFSNNGGNTSLENWLTGTTNGLQTIYEGTGVTPQVHANYYAGFLQDTIRLTRNVTVDLGVRYEFQPPYYQPNNLEGTFDLMNASGLGQEQSGVPLYHQDTWKHNFGPRGGLAWDVKGNGRSVVRVNGGIMYALTTYSGVSSMQNMPTAAQFFTPTGPVAGACPSFNNGGGGTTSTTPSPAFPTTTPNVFCTFGNPAGQNQIFAGTVETTAPLNWFVCSPGPITGTPLPGQINCGSVASGGNPLNAIFGGLSGAGLQCGDGLPVAVGSAVTNPSPCAIGFPVPNLYIPYITNWSLSLQQALGHNFSLNIAYLGNHGTGIRQQQDLNQALPGPKNGTANVYAQNLEQDRRPFTTNCPNGTIPGVVTGYTSGPCLPWLGEVLVEGNSDVSNYDAVQATLSLRAYHGVTANLNYTLAHCLDMFSGNENIWTYLSDSRDPQLDYGTCTTGTPQRITGNLNWNIPGRKSPLQLLEGWAVNSTATILPKRYLAFSDSSDDIAGVGNGPQTSSPGDRWDIFGTPHNFTTFGLSQGGSTIPCFGLAGVFGPTGTGHCTGSNGTTQVTLNGATYTVPTLGPGGICTTDALLLPNSPADVSAAPTAINGFTVPANTAMANLLTYGCYTEGGSVMLPPAQGNFGDMSRNCCLGTGFFQLDASVTKTFGFMKEQRIKAQFRVEIFNILNRTNYSSPGGGLASPSTLGAESGTPNVGANVVTGTGGEREVQLGLKFIW